MNFMQQVLDLQKQGRFVCVGLDTKADKVPASLYPNVKDPEDRMHWFNDAIVGATKDFVCAYKINMAFYARYPRALRNTIQSIRSKAPGVPIILDGKRGDIDNTNLGYVDELFNFGGADAATFSPYLGEKANAPFLTQKDKGLFFLVKTSNDGADEFQNLPVIVEGEDYPVPLYLHIADRLANHWGSHGNVGMVVGATYPEQLAEVRKIAPDTQILIPGIGAQGGDLEATVKVGLDPTGHGIIINSSRGIIYASSGEDFAEAAGKATKKLRDDINTIRASLGFH